MAIALPTARATPTLTKPPQDQSVSLGAKVTFSVSGAGNSPLSYQWLFNGAPLAGATNRTLILSNAAPVMAGPYAVILSDTDGSVTSDPAQLEVDATFTKIVSGPIATDKDDHEGMAPVPQ